MRYALFAAALLLSSCYLPGEVFLKMGWGVDVARAEGVTSPRGDRIRTDYDAEGERFRVWWEVVPTHGTTEITNLPSAGEPAWPAGYEWLADFDARWLVAAREDPPAKPDPVPQGAGGIAQGDPLPPTPEPVGGLTKFLQDVGLTGENLLIALCVALLVLGGLLGIGVFRLKKPLAMPYLERGTPFWRREKPPGK